jgi:hypothetical protein
MAMMQAFTNSNFISKVAIDYEGDGECEGDDEYVGDFEGDRGGGDHEDGDY